MAAETIKLKISPAVAERLRPGQSAQERLGSLESASSLESFDRLMLIFCLMRDGDNGVKVAAQSAFSALPCETLLAVAGSQDAHPAVLDAIAKVHSQREGIAEALLQSGTLSAPARAFLQRIIVHEPCEPHDQEPNSSDIAEEEGDELQSKYQMAQVMGIAEKIKMALTGDKEWRSILVKDANKLVSAGVIKNPRITEAEIVALLKSGVQNDEIMRLICANKEWVKNYNIRKALVDNNRTPIQKALRYLATLNEKDIGGYAKSKNVSSVISTQAKRILLNKIK